METKKSDQSLFVTMLVSILSFMFVREVFAQSTHDEWWALVEECVAVRVEQELSETGGLPAGSEFYIRWENICAERIPYPDTSADIEVATFTPEFEVRPFVQRDVMNAANYSRMEITSLNDSVTIEDVSVNRGNCDFTHTLREIKANFPMTLSYARKTTGYLTCNVGDVREVTIHTNVGDVTYRTR